MHGFFNFLEQCLASPERLGRLVRKFIKIATAASRSAADAEAREREWERDRDVARDAFLDDDAETREFFLDDIIVVNVFIITSEILI